VVIRAALAVAAAGLVTGPASPADPPVRVGGDGRLVYATDAHGDRVPDYSFAGFGGGVPIPGVAARVVVGPIAGDSAARIQAALDHVAKLVPDADGFRGAVQLLASRYEIGRTLHLPAGVVLRGRGPATVLVAAGMNRGALIAIRGRPDRRPIGSPRSVTDSYVPVNGREVRVESTDGWAVGDTVTVMRPGTKEWIFRIGMDQFPTKDTGSYLDWRPGTVDLAWDRRIEKIDGTMITLDAPITTALDASLSKATVRKYDAPGRVSRTGVEHLRCESAFDASRPKDEDHAWTGVVVENADDVWVRNVFFRHFAGSAVCIWETARRVTVADCDSAEPVSEEGGFRRHTFFTAGQQTLFLRCAATDGRHDFAVGHLAAGPNAFVHCRATNARRFSGPIGSWASGVLYDNVTIDGAGLELTNRETDDQGVGWAAANSMLWQCTAPKIVCRAPPGAQNWAVGVWGRFTGDGQWRQLNEFVKPDSLYAAQLRDRIGAKADAVLAKAVVPIEPKGITRFDPPAKPAEPTTKTLPLKLTNGWISAGDRLLTGGRTGTAWWKGNTLPARATEVGVGVTRFVPGRDGPGYTDDLADLTVEMRDRNIARLEHHWGLWYDRRRDDHEMVRRIDGDVWPPFYEQPWARSGQGAAWDGLSKYDLTRFNPWYFARLKEFADACGRTGRVLVLQTYFQHNILEAGAHWADFPWRPANCLQATGFPEPPDYAGGKRVFMAEAFYDVSHPVRRDLHRRYIRHCLDVLGDCPNVIFQTGEEYTGPLHFVQFWLDTVAEWQKETGKKVTVGLSATKDVQDAILADPARAPLVGVIDLKYWWYTADGGVYDPRGGENLAPRQQLRDWKGGKSRTAGSVARAVREYRAKYPEKAVTVSLDGDFAWAAWAAGGSLPAVPPGVPEELLAAAPRLKPFEAAGLPAGAYALAEPGRHYLIWVPAWGAVSVDLTDHSGSYSSAWLDLKTGRPRPGAMKLTGGGPVTIRTPAAGPAVLWVSRDSP
jgi:Family of unknown function (DUF6298)